MKEKVIVIAGPTGVGKTSLSLQLAQQFHGEIINGDAMQVYRGLDIGTAKITQSEMAGIPHHLIDCFSYQEEYNVMMFQKKARACITEIQRQGKLPIICGGTGLYIKSLLYDYEFIEQEKDEEFLSFLAQLSNEQLYALLRHVDEKACEKIHPNNRQRMIRAIEMAHLGEKKSTLIDQQEHTMLYDAYLIGLTMERSILYERINKRVDDMMEQGLLEEITTLVTQDPTIWTRQCFQSIGYKEWKAYFDGIQSKEACIDQIKKNSRNFAKRQYTWFRNQMELNWIDINEDGWQSHLVESIEKWLEVA